MAEKISKLVAIKKFIEGDFGGFVGRKVEAKELTQLTPEDRVELATEACAIMGCELFN